MTYVKSNILKVEKSRFSILIRENSNWVKNSDSVKKSDRAHAYIITRMITKLERRRIDKKKTRCLDWTRKEFFAFTYWSIKKKARNNKLRTYCHSFEQKNFLYRVLTRNRRRKKEMWKKKKLIVIEWSLSSILQKT
jgi:hypothetical protein